MTVSPALILYNLGLFISAIFSIVPVFLAFILFLYGVHILDVMQGYNYIAVTLCKLHMVSCYHSCSSFT